MTEPCPNCETPVEVSDDMEMSELLDCPGCGVKLEVVAVDPVALSLWEEEEK